MTDPAAKPGPLSIRRRDFLLANSDLVDREALDI